MSENESKNESGNSPAAPPGAEPPTGQKARTGEATGDVTVTRMSLKTQALRFIISGGISAIVDLGLLAILQLSFGLSVPVARTFSFIAGTTTAYIINSRWTFRSGQSAKSFVAVMALYALTFFINVGLQTLCSALFNSWGWSEPVAMVAAFIIAQGTGTTINFIVQRTIIFRHR